jgi:hypothetical protein
LVNYGSLETVRIDRAGILNGQMKTKKQKYRVFNAPSRLFQVEIPETWQVKMEHQRTTFYDPGRGAGALQISFYVRKDSRTPENDSPRDQMIRFLQLRKTTFAEDSIQALQIQKIPAAYYEYTQSQSDGKPREIFWRVWFICSDKVVAFLTYNCEKKHYQREYLTVTRIVQSFKIPDRIPLLTDAFLERVFTILTSRFPQVSVAPAENFSLILDDTVVNLENLYRSCAANPENQDMLIEDFFKSFMLGPKLVINGFEDIRDKIFPQIKPVEFFNEPLTSQLARLPFLDILSICFVYEMGKSFRFLNREILTKGFPDLDMIYRHSLNNVQRSSTNVKLNSGSVHGVSFVTMQGSDGLSAVRMLLPDFYKNVSRQLGPLFLVGIPFRDLMIAFEFKASKGVEKLIKKIREDHSTRIHPITSRILLMSPKGTQLYEQT